MRFVRMLALAAVLFCVFAEACGAPSLDPDRLQTQYNKPFTAEYTVRTHAGFCTEYQLSASGQNGSSTVLIRKPESVAGIRASLNGSLSQMKLEDLTVDALLPERKGYAPMDVLHVLFEDLKHRKPNAFSEEGDSLVLEYRMTFPDGIQGVKRIFLQKESLLLQSAELFLDGRLILSLQMDAPLRFSPDE